MERIEDAVKLVQIGVVSHETTNADRAFVTELKDNYLHIFEAAIRLNFFSKFFCVNFGGSDLRGRAEEQPNNGRE